MTKPRTEWKFKSGTVENDIAFFMVYVDEEMRGIVFVHENGDVKVDVDDKKTIHQSFLAACCAIEQIINTSDEWSPTALSTADLPMTCRHCRTEFSPEDEWRTCPECMHNHCEACGHCWDAGDTDICPVCDPFENRMRRLNYQKDYGPHDNDYHSDQLLMAQ